MSVIGGITGVVEKGAVAVTAVGRWSINHTADLQAVVSSATAQAEVTISGNKDWSGSYEAFGFVPAIIPGEGFVFHGSFDSATGANGTAVCDSVEIVYDIESGAPVKHTVNFSSNGALTIGADALEAVITAIAPLTSIGASVTISDVLESPSYAAITDVRTVTLTLTRANTSYVSSSTAGSTKRVVGPLSGELSISVYTEDASNLPQLNEVNFLRINDVNTDVWELIAVVWSELADIGANIEEGSPVEVNLTARWSGFYLNQAGDDWDQGSIKHGPVIGLTTLWPPA